MYFVVLILLFGYKRLDVFPIDTWVKKYIVEHYNIKDDVKEIKLFAEKNFKEYSGLVIQYMFGVILSCYREFESRITVVEKAGTKSTSYDIVKAYISERIGKFSKQEVLVSCPSLGSSSVESALKKLVDDGTLIRIGAGRKTLYARADSLTK